MRYPLLILLLQSLWGFGQHITPPQQKALNNYVDYANQSADEVTLVVRAIISYYPSLHQKRSFGAPRFTCPVQLEEYYLNLALEGSKMLPSAYQEKLSERLRDLRAASEKIDHHCKALDTYHKLEDYKRDNFVQAEKLVRELQDLVSACSEKQDALRLELESVYKKLNAGVANNDYQKSAAMIQAEVLRERSFLNLLTFNLNEELHTHWPVDKLQQSIQETDNAIKAMQQYKPTLKYPASSMWTGFLGSLNSVLTLKRDGLDDYNFEAKKSDKHSNDFYLGLINHFNGTLVSDQNSFIQFSATDGFFGLKAIKYFPVFVIKTDQEIPDVEVKFFHDIPRVPIAIAGQKNAISAPVYEALSNYIEFINETWRQTRNLQMDLSGFRSTAAYYRTLESFEKRAGMSFDYKNFKLPLSQYQKTIADSHVLAPSHMSSLNQQCEVLLNMLKEMDELGASLEMEVKEKRYEKDHLDRVYAILARQDILFNLWDDRKELLYLDVRKIYDAYPPANVADSWFISGRALRELTDLDRDGLFVAKAHYEGDAKITAVSTDKIDETLRDVISKEYDNMKGIVKIGRNNGLCPYTPYEDLPLTSRDLSEELKKLKPVTGNASLYDHPYHKMVYHYNDVVDDYNKFCELSKSVPHLMTIHQPELYQNSNPVPGNRKSGETVGPTAVIVPVVAQSSTTPQPTPDRVVESTKFQHDTIYIERRDTVYLSDPDENLRSMTGYATNNMILLLDVSGSMNAPEKLPLLKKSVLDLMSMMRQEDEVSIIAFSEKPKALLTASSFKDEEKIRKAINGLKSSGKTDGNAAMKLAYKIADENYVRGGNNRIILATDGQFTLSTDTRQLIERFSAEDIFLSVFNFGKGAGSSKALSELAAVGKGNYAYISGDNVDITLIREAKAKKQK